MVCILVCVFVCVPSPPITQWDDIRGDFGRRLVSQSIVFLHKVRGLPYKQESSLIPCAAGGSPKKSALWTRNHALTRQRVNQYLELATSGTMRKKHLLFKVLTWDWRDSTRVQRLPYMWLNPVQSLAPHGPSGWLRRFSALQGPSNTTSQVFTLNLCSVWLRILGSVSWVPGATFVKSPNKLNTIFFITFAFSLERYDGRAEVSLGVTALGLFTPSRTPGCSEFSSVWPETIPKWMSGFVPALPGWSYLHLSRLWFLGRSPILFLLLGGLENSIILASRIIYPLRDQTLPWFLKLLPPQMHRTLWCSRLGGSKGHGEEAKAAED